MKSNHKLQILTCCVFCLAGIVSQVHGQVPQLLYYQAQLEPDANGNFPNGTIPMVFEIFDTPTGGKALVTQAQSIKVTNGVFNVLLAAPFSAFADGTERYLQVTINGVQLSRRRFDSAAYAFRTGSVKAANQSGKLMAQLSVDNQDKGFMEILSGNPARRAIFATSNDNNQDAFQLFSQSTQGRAALLTNPTGGGKLRLVDRNQDTVVVASAEPDGGRLSVNADRNSLARAIMSVFTDVNTMDVFGALGIYSGTGALTALATSNIGGGGFVAADANNGSEAVEVTTSSVGAGVIRVKNADGKVRVGFSLNVANDGALFTYALDGDDAASISTQAGSTPANATGTVFANNSSGEDAVEVYGDFSTQDGRLNVNAAGDVPKINLVGGTGALVCTQVIAQNKIITMDHPLDPSKEIYHSLFEGPEVSVYTRGTARLVNGEARLQLPDHFAWMAAAKGMTVNLTPLSAASEGLVVVSKSPREIVVRERRNGTGAYEFDYIVHAIRKDYEDFQVVRDKIGVNSTK